MEFETANIPKCFHANIPRIYQSPITLISTKAKGNTRGSKESNIPRCANTNIPKHNHSPDILPKSMW